MTHEAHSIADCESQALGIYLHVPYCRVACPYCDFVKRPVEGDAPDKFTDAVCNEIREFEGPRYAQTIFFGGGTPSLLTAEAMTRIFETLRTRFMFPEEPEISIEVNPDDVTNERVSLWRDVGVNRISLGVQAFDDDVLTFLGRCHDAKVARDACGLIADNFANWGIDLIFGAKPADRWNVSLAEAKRFDPPHVSTYCLTYEERTPFWNHRFEAVDDDATLAMYRSAMDALGTYNHYEVSNFAMPGFESAHNRIYWRNEQYTGFGPGAVAYVGGVRSRNLSNIAAYLEAPGEKEESLWLSDQEEKAETLIQHFRTNAGISGEIYAARFAGASLEDDFGNVLGNLIDRGLLTMDATAYRPTVKGYELNNEIGLALV